MGLLNDVGDGPVAIDTAPFIYFIEEHEVYFPVVAPFFEALAEGKVKAVTSTLTLLETLVVPLRTGAHALAESYERLLTKSRGLRLIDIDLHLIRGAATIRAATGLRTPDALQVATALRAGCSALLSNDIAWPHVPGLRMVQLRDYLPRPS